MAALVLLQVRVIQVPSVAVLGGVWLAPGRTCAPHTHTVTPLRARAVQLPRDSSPASVHSPTLSGAPEPGAFSRTPFRVAGWELLLLLLTFCLEFESFLNGSLNFPQGFCRCPIFIIESAHQLPHGIVVVAVEAQPAVDGEQLRRRQSRHVVHQPRRGEVAAGKRSGGISACGSGRGETPGTE